MTVLSQNLRTIRKNLHCTQMAISEVLDIGFRTYVRYESGERDAPVSILIKLARLGNMSLDRLLTTQITPQDLETPDVDKPPSTPTKLEVIGGGLEEGRLVFKGLKNDFMFTATLPEKNLLDRFRKMDRLAKEKFLLELEWMLKNPSPKRQQGKKKIPKKILKSKNAARLKKLAKSIKQITLKG